MRRRPFSRHDGFFASLQRVEDRLASEQHHEQEQDPAPPAPATARQPDPSPFTDTMATASPLLLLDSAPPSAPASGGGSSGPALDFLTASTEQGQRVQHDDDDEDHGGGGVEEDIARLMALLGLSPPPPPDGDADDGTGGCDCSGADGFLARVVGVAGPKCDGEKRRLDGWIHHYHRGEGGRVREPARLAHLLLARASGDAAAVASPATVKEFLDRDPPRQSTDESE
ncbi:unnamed protein product [Urochloa decumbens]|uniref:Uncharacterized protein n=1 Tax=Urochloa decumbens TaxID=240449 RepID=A0ABC9D4V3_9POAL